MGIKSLNTCLNHRNLACTEAYDATRASLAETFIYTKVFICGLDKSDLTDFDPALLLSKERDLDWFKAPDAKCGYLLSRLLMGDLGIVCSFDLTSLIFLT